MIRSLLLSFFSSTLLSGVAALASPPQDPPDALTGRLDELAQVVRAACEDGAVVGAEVLVLKDGEVLLHEAFGWLDREDERPLAVGTIYNLRSMTKSVVGAAAQILVDEGALELDAPVARYLPAFDRDGLRGITVDQVSSHRAGFPLTILQKLDEFEDLQAQAAGVAEKGTEFEPGSRFWYSDAGADVLGAVVEAVSGERLDAFVARRVLEPLGMTDSFFSAPPDDPRWSRVASVYMRVPATGEFVRIMVPDGKSIYPFAWGSQSLYGSARDYCRFLEMWAARGLAADGERVVSERGVASQLEPLSPMSALGSAMSMPTGFPRMQVWYGRMAVLYRPLDAAAGDPSPVISHSGSDGTIAWAWPDHGLVAAVFTQSRGSTQVLRLESDVHRLLLEPDINDHAPAEWGSLYGHYLVADGPLAGRRVEVLVNNGQLSLDVPGELVFALTEADEEGWRSFELRPEVRVRFDLADGACDALDYEVQGQGGRAERFDPAAPPEEPAPAGPEADLSPFVGVYHDPEADADLEMVDRDGKLTAMHPSVPMPLGFAGPDEGGFFTLELNPAVRIRFTRGEDGKVDGYEVHTGGQVVRRERVGDLED